MAHSSSRPSRAPAVVATVSGASVLIDAVTSAMTGSRKKCCHAGSSEVGGEKRAGGGKEENSTDGQLRRKKPREPVCLPM